MSLSKFSNVSSKSHMLDSKENLPQSKQTVTFFHFVVHSGLFYNILYYFPKFSFTQYPSDITKFWRLEGSAECD